MDRQRLHILYLGRVQGVGFRYTVKALATGFTLTGAVRNLPDGRVELWAEGSKDSIEDLIEKLKDHFGGYIHSVNADYLGATLEFTDFKVAF